MTVKAAITVENVTLPRLWRCLWARSPSAGRRERLVGPPRGRFARCRPHVKVQAATERGGATAAPRPRDALVVAESGHSRRPSCAGPACPDRARRDRAVRLMRIE
jgi:hypothetical protein